MYSSRFENAPDAITVVDGDTGEIAEMNAVARELLGYSREDIAGKTVWDAGVYGDPAIAREIVAETLSNGYYRSGGRSLKRKDGRRLLAEWVCSHCPRDGKNLILCIFRDILEERQEEETRLRLAAIVESSDDAIIGKTLDGIITSWNIGAEKIYLYPAKEIVGKSISVIIPPERSGELPQILGRIRLGEKVEHYETERVRKNGSRLFVSLTVSPIRNREGTIIGASAIARDITPRRKAEELIRHNRQLMAAAMDLAHIVTWEYDVATDLLTVDDRFFDFYGTTAEREGGYTMTGKKYIGEFVYPEDVHIVTDELVRVRDPAMAPDPTQIEHRILRRDGEIRFIIARYAPVFDSDGRAMQTYGANQDITERKAMEEQVARSLHDKELLIKEVHHRVKNNMQVISSLLFMQARKQSDANVKGILQESQNRIKSIALVHEKLYQSASLDQIDYTEYLRKITDHLFESYNVDPRTVTLVLDTSGIVLHIDKAVPCSLILNEMISNSIKYAFPGGRTGKISISFTKGPEQYTLIYSDDGVGIPEGITFDRTESLGMQLIRGLTKQINGEIALDRTGGTTYTITFPV